MIQPITQRSDRCPQVPILKRRTDRDASGPAIALPRGGDPHRPAETQERGNAYSVAPHVDAPDNSIAQPRLACHDRIAPDERNKSSAGAVPGQSGVDAVVPLPEHPRAPSAWWPGRRLVISGCGK
jgi:hypothetical protein